MVKYPDLKNEPVTIYSYNRRGLKPLIVLLASSRYYIMSFSSADVKTLLNIFSINPVQSYISEETRYPVKFNSKKAKLSDIRPRSFRT